MNTIIYLTKINISQFKNTVAFRGLHYSTSQRNRVLMPKIVNIQEKILGIFMLIKILSEKYHRL